MSLTRIRLERFTAFHELDLTLSPGINIFIGENGTGKTHLLKVAYAACDITKTKASFAGKLTRVFRPYEDRIGRLVHRTSKSTRAAVEVYRGALKLRSSFTNHAKEARSAKIRGKDAWVSSELECVYIPVKEVLANAPGFRSLYASRDIAFEEIYADLIDRAFRPLLRGPTEARRKKLLLIIQGAIDGKVLHKDEHFFLRNKQGELEFTLLSDGLLFCAGVPAWSMKGQMVESAEVEFPERGDERLEFLMAQRRQFHGGAAHATAHFQAAAEVPQGEAPSREADRAGHQKSP